jgi:FkbM family methyltransferase
MPFYDFIEIGTSDFDTEIQKNDSKSGISIEPIKYYLDKLPNKKNCIKLNIGVSNYNGKCIVNYLSEETIKKYNLPDWVRGCNSINSYHITVSNLCREKFIDIEKISEKDEVEVSTVYQIMSKFDVNSVYFLKIDTEGHDTIILKKLYEEIQFTLEKPVFNLNIKDLFNFQKTSEDLSNILKSGTSLSDDHAQIIYQILENRMESYKILQNNIDLLPTTSFYLPHVIQFESNILSSIENINEIINLFSNIGYDLISRSPIDTILKLNLKNLKNKKTFTVAMNKYYIMDYPLNYNISDLPHKNTLEDAKYYCIKYNCSGITLQDGIYQVRDGKYVNYFNSDIYSWIFV